MKHTILLTLLSFASTAIAEEAPNTVFVKFDNERRPTADAGVGPGMDVVRDGEYLYMLQQRHLVVLSVKDPARPAVIGKLENVGNLRQIAVRGNVAYITAREDGLFVVDVTDRTSPQLLSHYDTLEFATGIMPDMRCGGYCACGPYALVTRGGGYSFYRPLPAGKCDSEMPIYRIPGGPVFQGKPTVRGNVLAACNRVDGDVTVLDITDLKAPRLIRKFKVSGNPDLPLIGDGYLMIPAGYQGLIRFDL